MNNHLQKRDAPAYLEYAASLISKLEYRTLTLQERGLLWSMRLECWVNRSLPSNPEKLAKILGFNVSEINDNLPSIMSFFSSKNGIIVCPELDSYLDHINARRDKQISDGKKGAEKTNSKRNAKSGDPDGDTGGDTDGVLVQQSKAQQSQVQFHDGSVADLSDFVECTDNEYDRASNGG